MTIICTENSQHVLRPGRFHLARVIALQGICARAAKAARVLIRQEDDSPLKLSQARRSSKCHRHNILNPLLHLGPRHRRHDTRPGLALCCWTHCLQANCKNSLQIPLPAVLRDSDVGSPQGHFFSALFCVMMGPASQLPCREEAPLQPRSLRTNNRSRATCTFCAVATIM